MLVLPPRHSISVPSLPSICIVFPAAFEGRGFLDVTVRDGGTGYRQRRQQGRSRTGAAGTAAAAAVDTRSD